MVKVVDLPPMVTLIVYETFSFAKVKAGIVTLPDAETLILPKETDLPRESTNDADPDAPERNPVTVTRVGTSTGI